MGERKEKGVAVNSRIDMYTTSKFAVEKKGGQKKGVGFHSSYTLHGKNNNKGGKGGTRVNSSGMPMKTEISEGETWGRKFVYIEG